MNDKELTLGEELKDAINLYEVGTLSRQIKESIYPDPIWVVPEILTAGLGLAYGPPKIGKSVLNLQLARAVAAGGVFLGRECEPGLVLYLALEDHNRRIQDRTNKQGWTDDVHDRVVFITMNDELIAKTGYINDGLANSIRRTVIEEGPRLVIIDILGKVFEGDLNDYSAVIQGLEPIQNTAHETNCCVMLVHHSRKRGANKDDLIEGALGSTAITGAPDTVWRISPEPTTKGHALLEITGRDLDESSIELDIEQDLDNFCWVLSTGEFTDSEQRVITALEGQPPLTKSEIARVLDDNRGSVSRQIDKLVEKGFIFGDKNRKYQIEERSFFDGQPIFD